LASLFEPDQAYGPGKPASPSWAAILKDAKPKVTFKKPGLVKSAAPKWAADYSYQNILNQYLSHSFDSLYENLYGPKKSSKHSLNNWDGSYYGEVGRALGFTETEIRHLVHGNDSGLSFPTLAALIEEHPPVLSSAYTARRATEEKAFCDNVLAAIAHHNAQNKPSKSATQWAIGGAMMPWKYYSESLTISMDDATSSPNAAWYSDFTGGLNTKHFAPKHGLVVPETGEYAKLLGIWLPS
jgi:hypothetical protein